MPSKSLPSVSFLFNGDYKALMRSLQAVEFTDLSITEPDMEEIFLHFYGKAGEHS